MAGDYPKNFRVSIKTCCSYGRIERDNAADGPLGRSPIYFVGSDKYLLLLMSVECKELLISSSVRDAFQVF